MEVIATKIPDVLLIKPRVFQDSRGFFYESFQQKRYQEFGINLKFVQDNCSRSTQGTLRGLHYQRQHAQGKLVSVVRGSVLDVAVDIRPGSPYFGQWVSEILSDENHHQLYIPPGFAHGFYVLSEIADFHYKCTDYYYPEYDGGIIWNDPKLAIDWNLKGQPELSSKDQQFSFLSEIALKDLPSI